MKMHAVVPTMLGASVLLMSLFATAAPPPVQAPPQVYPVLAAMEGGMQKITMPIVSQMALDRSVTWTHPRTDTEAPLLGYLGSEPKTLHLQFQLDAADAKGSVGDRLAQIEQLTVVSQDLKRPPMVSFTWGSNLPVFQGVIENLGVKYTMFAADGTPTRATVDLDMRRAAKLTIGGAAPCPTTAK